MRHTEQQRRELTAAFEALQTASSQVHTLMKDLPEVIFSEIQEIDSDIGTLVDGLVDDGFLNEID